MYTPRHFALDTASAIEIAQRRGAGELVTHASGGLEASLVPFTVDVESGPTCVVRTHLSKANDLGEHLHERPALLLVHVVDGYVSPRWYASTGEHGRAVPTWNYVTVHMHGTATVHRDREWLLAHVRALTEAQEGGRELPWAVADATAGFIEAKLSGIVGVELQVTRVEGKAKLSQNRSDADVNGVVEGLEAEGRDELARWVESANGRT